jgi:hypothetical protein
MGRDKQESFEPSVSFQRNFKARARAYGEFVKAYKDPELSFKMVENLNFY